MNAVERQLSTGDLARIELARLQGERSPEPGTRWAASIAIELARIDAGR